MPGSPFGNKGLISLAAGNKAKSTLRYQPSLWTTVAEEYCCFFLLSGAAHIHCLNQCHNMIWDNSEGPCHASSSAPMGLADSFVRTTVQLIISLCPTLDHPCLPKLVLRTLFINVPHANFHLQNCFQGIQPGTLTTACRDLHNLSSAYLSSSPHFTALRLLLDTVTSFDPLTALLLEDLCIFIVLCWSTLLPLYSAGYFLLFRHQLFKVLNSNSSPSQVTLCSFFPSLY